MKRFKHNNDFLCIFENECWFFYSHILEAIIGGEYVGDLKKRFDPKKVEFFEKWHKDNKHDSKQQVAPGVPGKKKKKKKGKKKHR